MTKNNTLQTNNSLLRRNKYVIISFFSAAAVMLVIYFVTSVFPFGGNTVLRMDLYHQYGPLFAELYDKVKNSKSFLYSWQSGLGSCFLGNYFNYLSSPIAAVIMFFNHENIPEAISLMVLIKAALSSATFTYYLKKSQKNHSVTTVIFGILYAFCAYMLAYYWNVMWLDAMVLLPIILLGIERIVENGKIGLYVFSLALSMFSNYYMSYMLCIFAVVYFFYCILSGKSNPVLSLEYKNEHPKGFINKIKNSRFWRSCFLFGIGSLLAGGLMAFALLPTYSILRSCSATSGTFPTESKIYFDFFDFLANHFTAAETTIRSSGDDVLPNVYCGILTIILAPLYFFTSSISKKEKAATLGLLVFFYFSFNLNGFNYIWHGFHFPNDLPYRFSFMYSFILLVMAYKTFMRLNEFTSKQIGAVGAVIALLVFITEKVGSKNIEYGSVILTLLFTVIYVLILTVFKDKRYEKASLAILLCVCCASEIIVCHSKSLPNNITSESYESDYEDFSTVKEHLDTIEQDGFYRMELTNLRTRMDPSWFGYNGVSVFSSMAYENLAKLEDRLGMMSNGINSYTYNPQTPVYNMMHAIKYIVNNETPNILSNEYYEHLYSIDKYDAYENKYYLPIAYCVNSDILNWNYHKDTSSKNVDPFLVQGDYFDKATGVGNPFEKIDISYINYSNVNPFSEDNSAGSYMYNKNTADEDGSATFYITTQKTGNVYIYYHVDSASSKDITVNSNYGTIVHSASQDSILDLGRFEANETITINVPFEANSGTMRLRVYTLNDDTFQKGYKKLSNASINIKTFEDTYIEGTFTAKDDCVLYTSIPYDEGWSIVIDGKNVESENIVALGDALIAVKVAKGNHEINFKYTPKGLSTGLKISAVSLFIVILYFILLLLIKRRGIKSKLPAFAPVNNKYNELITFEDKKVQSIKIKETKYISQPPTITAKKGEIKKEIICPPTEKNDVVKEIIIPKTDNNE